MSLIVARKEAASLLIVSDTHLSHADIKAVASGQKRHPSTGVVKTAIIRSDIAISFAGGEKDADEAFQRLKGDTPLSVIKDILLQSHINSHEKTDFILAVGGSSCQLFEIKNSKCIEAEAAWIGSQRAFAAFQAFMQGKAEIQSSGFIFMEREIEEAQTGLFSTMSRAMDYVIENETIPEVDGFRVSTVYTEGRFEYNGYCHAYMSMRPIEIEIPEGVDSISFPIVHGSAADGGYLINFFRSPNPGYAAIHINTGSFGIVYKRENGGLMRPTIMSSIDEVDFTDYVDNSFGARPGMITQDKSDKYKELGDKLFNDKDFEGALQWYDKALMHCDGIDRAVFYHRKAVTYANLTKYADVLISLNEATKNDLRYQNAAFSLMEKIRKSGVRLQ